MDGIGPCEQADRRHHSDVVFIFGKPLDSAERVVHQGRKTLMSQGLEKKSI
ncbi:MAG: hypothetical protein BTN85_2088 [Candidatus Methanohalarchaeum thermophilum]|uniref:Uncharacterized protein n=1 Tax=Methanohalarchaeum thermophilum TaxID=1903181 RepID=A0A1Q6DSX7_METT1|nr:MAG: hypothetical protein BTN85_2088 [Candidatus Methanohalarchaeum thermophilum]